MESASLMQGDYLIKGGAVITVDESLGTLPRADILIRSGEIVHVGEGIEAGSTEVIDAHDMIVMPGMIDSHYHMWSTLDRNLIADDIGYFDAKWATSSHYTPEDFYNSVLLGLAELSNGGVTTVNNWSHNNRSSAHVDAELRAHQHSFMRARYSMGHVDRLATDEVNQFADLGRVQGEWFGQSGPLRGLVHLGVNLRGMVQSTARVFHEEMQHILSLGLPVSVHASQDEPNSDDASDYEARGYLGPRFLFCHYLAATDDDLSAMFRTRTPLSFATHSEMRLGNSGNPRRSLLRARQAGVTVSLSSDATSIAPPNMFENMRLVWNNSIPWRGTDTEDAKPLGFGEAIRMATLDGAVALGLGDVTGSLTPGKRADIVLLRTDSLNIAPVGNIETTVVQSATPADVDTVLVDGRIIKRHGVLTNVDAKEVVARAKSSSLRIRRAAGLLS